MLTVDSPPRIDGHRLHLEFEVMLPAGEALPKEGEDTLTVMVTGFTEAESPDTALRLSGQCNATGAGRRPRCRSQIVTLNTAS